MNWMTAAELTDALDAATEAARRGAAELERWRGKFATREKARADLVTDADQASQDAVKGYLAERFPGFGFLGEEECVGLTPEQTRPPAAAPPTWVVDPLDGTVNYVHDVPAYCVSIGLWACGVCVVGVILDPRQNETFAAARGHGATLNGKPIRVSDTAHLSQALISTGFPYKIEAQRRNLAAWARVTEHSQALRRTGSTALNLAYVACGRFDGYWAFDNYPWDVAGGACLVAEAGGELSAVDGTAFDPFRPDLLATNGRYHRELLEVLDGPNA